MTPEEKINSTLNAVGSLAELLGLFRRHLEDQGFSDIEAITLCGVFLKALMTSPNGGDA